MTRTTTRVTTRTAPDRQVRQLAMWLDIYATEVAIARDVLEERIANAANGSTGNNNAGERVHTSRGSSTTETRALAALHHQQQMDRLEASIPKHPDGYCECNVVTWCQSCDDGRTRARDMLARIDAQRPHQHDHHQRRSAA